MAALLIVTYLILDRLLIYKTEHGIMQARNMYAQPRNTIDVVMMGSSHIHCDVNTALLWEDYGIAAYDYSAAEQPLWITYYYLKEICKYQNPKVVVLDLYSPARFKEDYQYDWLKDNLLGVRFSLNKLQMLAAACEPEHFFEYFPSMAAYHNRYSDLSAEDFQALFETSKERAAYKGYTPYFNIRQQEQPEIEQGSSGGITIKSEEYLQKIIKYTKDHDIELFLIVSPYITSNEDENVYNRISEIAEQNDIHFNSTNFNYDEMGLDFEQDFNDESHLNYQGSCKFSDYLGKELHDRFEIPDHRGDAKYESWDRHATEMDEYVKEVLEGDENALKHAESIMNHEE